jgi:hypothetical protein
LLSGDCRGPQGLQTLQAEKIGRNGFMSQRVGRGCRSETPNGLAPFERRESGVVGRNPLGLRFSASSEVENKRARGAGERKVLSPMSGKVTPARCKSSGEHRLHSAPNTGSGAGCTAGFVGSNRWSVGAKPWGLVKERRSGSVAGNRCRATEPEKSSGERSPGVWEAEKRFRERMG